MESITALTGVEKVRCSRLLGDAMRGDSESFGRQDIVDAQWRIVEPILADPPPYRDYKPGPEAADALIGADGPWRNPEPSVG